MLPVIKARASQATIVKSETGRPHDPQLGVGGDTRASNVSRVLRNLWLIQNNVEAWSVQAIYLVGATSSTSNHLSIEFAAKGENQTSQPRVAKPLGRIERWSRLPECRSYWRSYPKLQTLAPERRVGRIPEPHQAPSVSIESQVSGGGFEKRTRLTRPPSHRRQSEAVCRSPSGRQHGWLELSSQPKEQKSRVTKGCGLRRARCSSSSHSNCGSSRLADRLELSSVNRSGYVGWHCCLQD